MKKLLTVSIAAYNGAATLAEALDSCLIPGLDELDVIVVDDGSTDATARIAQEYAARFPDSIRLVRKENGGYGTTILAALDVACGRYFRTLDCDDWFEKKGLQQSLDYLHQCDTDVVVSGYRTVRPDKTGETFPVRQECCENTVYAFENLPEFPMEMHALTFRTTLLRAAKLTLPQHVNYTDMQYTFCGLMAAQNVSFCHAMVYCYRLGRDGQSVGLESYRRHTADYIAVAKNIFSVIEQATADDSGAKEQRMQRRAADIALFQLQNFLRFPPCRETKHKMYAFDRELKAEYPEIYHAVSRKNIRLLRASHYLLYRPLSWWERKKYQ